MKLNYLAVIVTAILSLGLGYLWFTVFFGKPWAKIMNYDRSVQPTKQGMMRSFAIFLVGAVFTSLVFAGLIEAARMIAYFGYLPKGTEPLLMVLAVWLGFYLPQSLGRVSWEGKCWGFVVINAGYDLVRLLMMAGIFWFWRASAGSVS